MASEVEQVAKNATGSCFAKVHDVFTLTCSSYSKTDADSPSSAAANNNTKAFSSFKTPSEVPTAPGVGGYARWLQSSPASTNAESKGGEPIQDGPSTPLRYLARPKHIRDETPHSTNSLPSLSLAVGLSTAYKEDFEQEDEENTKFNSPSFFLGKSGRGPQSLLKLDSSDGPGAFATGGMATMSSSKVDAIQQPDVYQHSAMLTNNPQAFSSVNSAFNLQASGAIPHIVPMTLNTVSSNTRQILQCQDPLQGGAYGESFKIPASTTSQFSYATFKGNRLEAVNFMPILQTPPMPGFGGQQLTKNEGNLSLGNKSCQESGRKRKLVSQVKPIVHTTAHSPEDMGKGFLEARDGAENDGHCHKKKQFKLSKPPNDKTENLKLVNGFAGLQNMNRVEKLGNFAVSLSLKLNSNDVIDTLVSYSSRSNIQGYSDSEPGKTSDTLASDAATTEALIKQPKIGNIEGQNLDGQSQVLGLKLLTFPAHSPMPVAVSTFSSGGPTLLQNIMQEGSHRDSHVAKRDSSQKTPSFESGWGKYLKLSPAPDSSLLVNEGKTETILPYQKRFIELQAFLKRCDEPDQGYLKTLRSLSAAARSEHAVELENRAILLSLEEVKEIGRMKMLDVFAKNPESRAADEAGTTKQVAQLPAIVSTKAHIVPNP